MIVFGPIPSRRLGNSLGVNNIPSKQCSYSCVYCQAGRTPRTLVNRAAFYEPDEVAGAVGAKLSECRQLGVTVDFVSFVPDGEPTLDANLGAEIRAIKKFGVPVAVLTNGSMLWRDDVRTDLAAADLVSVEIDTLRELPWRMLDRPNPRLDLGQILEGIRTFARDYRGRLYTQTMLAAEINDDPASVDEVADFIAELKPARSYLAVPTRPPAESRVRPPAEEALLRAYAAMTAKLPNVELLRGEQRGTLTAAGDRTANLLATLAVHPMRREAVEHYLGGADPLDQLLRSQLVKSVDYEGQSFVVSANR